MNDTPGGVCDYCNADEGRCWDDCPTVKVKQQADEIERLREALRFYADRNHKSDDGDCIESGQTARAALQQKESE